MRCKELIFFKNCPLCGKTWHHFLAVVHEHVCAYVDGKKKKKIKWKRRGLMYAYKQHYPAVEDHRFCRSYVLAAVGIGDFKIYVKI